ncbi:hypothetical protein [Salaquimonas pukyongi]|uniref:hypothetical protein n=1 Tax=Salaquimonas pukyongi TaxID=2712698 RepID=UPI00096B86BF|nr:hypothetical protein [Salaquimonas pukyongi]
MAGSIHAGSRLSVFLADHGLARFGDFVIEPGDIISKSHRHLAGRTALLFGNAGGSLWQHFSASAEYRDEKSDPLDRWTRRIVVESVGQLTVKEQEDVESLFPFGKPLWPFQRWAKRAMGISASPLGLLIHPQYGLWFALRAAIVLPQAGQAVGNVSPGEKILHPCDRCVEKPCLSACPAGAFGQEGFDAAACRGHLGSARAPDCVTLGCAARNACPVGAGWRYDEAQLRFHMAAFNHPRM